MCYQRDLVRSSIPIRSRDNSLSRPQSKLTTTLVIPWFQFCSLLIGRNKTCAIPINFHVSLLGANRERGRVWMSQAVTSFSTGCFQQTPACRSFHPDWYQARTRAKGFEAKCNLLLAKLIASQQTNFHFVCAQLRAEKLAIDCGFIDGNFWFLRAKSIYQNQLIFLGVVSCQYLGQLELTKKNLRFWKIHFN